MNCGSKPKFGNKKLKKQNPKKLPMTCPDK